MIDERADAGGDNAYMATTTVTSFRIIEALERHDGVTVSELVDELGLASGTVYKHLNTLREIQYVRKDGHEYRLGLGFLSLGTTARRQTNLHEKTLDGLTRVAETTGKITSLMVPEHGFGVYLTQVVPEGAPTPPHREGERVHLHATAGGKAILAHQPTEKLDEWIADRKLQAVTDETVTDPDSLRSELRSVRDRRTAHSQGEQFDGWHSVATPVTDEDNVAVAAVSLTDRIDTDGGSAEMTEVRNILGSIVVSIETKLRSE